MGQVTTLNALGWVTLALADHGAAEDDFRKAIEIGYNEQLTPAVLEALWGLVQSSADGSHSAQNHRPAWNTSVLELVFAHPAASQTLRQQVGQYIERLKVAARLPDKPVTDRQKNSLISLDDLIGQI